MTAQVLEGSKSTNGSNDPATPTPQSLHFVLHTANSYFNISQTQSTIAPDTNPPPDVDNISNKLKELKVTQPIDIKSLKEFETLGLTGNIISAVAHIPYAVAITKDGSFEITPRPGKSILRDALSYLSSSSTGKHTVVGWTGEILPALSAKFGELLTKRRLSQEGQENMETLAGQLGNVAIHDLSGSGFNRSFMQHFKDNNPANRDMPVSKERRRELETLLENAFHNKIVPVWLGEWTDEKYDTLIVKDQERWQKYAEEELYQTLHHIGFHEHDREDAGQIFADYKRFNESVADAIVKNYHPGDIIWIHDYQLMLLPEIIRKKLPSAYIAYFHHAGFSPKEVLQKLPEHEEIMAGVLGASVVGVHSGGFRNYVEDYFLQVTKLVNCGDGVLSLNGRHISFFNVPVGIDVVGVQHAAFDDGKVESHMREISEIYNDKKIIVARTRLDRPKGIRFLLEALECLLNQYPEWRQRVVLFLITTSDTLHQKGKSPAQGDLDGETALRVMNINSHFGSVVHQPIVYLNRYLAAPEYFALLRLSDIGVVTSDHEGVNAMAMEYVVCQQGKYSPLLISERSITGDESMTQKLDDSNILACPSDTAKMIRNGLVMDDAAKQQRHAEILDYFIKHNAATFTDEFLTRACTSFVKYRPFENAPDLDLSALPQKYNDAEKRLFMFDYDGTLTPIVNDPDAAIPTEILLKSLTKLATNPQNRVWIISGRSRVFLEKQFGHIKGVGLSAEHGSFIRRPGNNQNNWHNLAASMDMGWKVEAEKVFTELCNDFPGSRIERKEVAIVWHYRNAANHDSCLAKTIDVKAMLESDRLKNWDVEVMLGKANLEVRPRFLNKGATATELIGDTFGDSEIGFVLCAGDDVTDEDMFRALLSSKLKKDGVFSVLVSPEGKPSLAYHRVTEPLKLVDAVALLSSQ